MPTLQLQDVCYRYAGVHVLEEVTLDVNRGELVALVGRNGAGKSTLLRVAAGWTRPARGTVTIDGLPLPRHEREARQRIVFVTDTPPFYDDLTAREHITLVLNANRARAKESDAVRLLEAFSLIDAADAYPSTFSRGMRHKAALALALALRPAVILLDEPFGPLDPASAEVLWEELSAAASAGSAVLFSGHLMPGCVRPDRVLWLDDGRITERLPGAVDASR